MGDPDLQRVFGLVVGENDLFGGVRPAGRGEQGQQKGGHQDAGRDRAPVQTASASRVPGRLSSGIIMSVSPFVVVRSRAKASRSRDFPVIPVVLIRCAACPLSDDDLHVLVEGEALQRPAGGDPPAVRHHLIHRLVRPLLVVVEEAETADAGVEGEAQGVRVDGMAPGPGQTVILGDGIRRRGRGGPPLSRRRSNPRIPGRPDAGRSARCRSERRRISPLPRNGIPSPGWGG